MRRPLAPSTRGCAPAILVALLLQGAAAGETPPELPRVTSSTELSLVNLDVVVTGKDGRPVAGLSASDFEVTHGGRPVAVTNFREERPAPRGEAPAEPRPPVPAGEAPPPRATPAAPDAPGVPGVPEAPDAYRSKRHVVLFVDRLALPDPKERREVFSSLKALLRRSIGPGDEAMVVSWQRSVRTVHPFTGDLEALDRAVDAVAASAIRVAGEETEIERLASSGWIRTRTSRSASRGSRPCGSGRGGTGRRWR